MFSTIALFLQALKNFKKGVNDALKPGKNIFRPEFTLKRVDKNLIKDLIYKVDKFKNGKCEWPQGKVLKGNKCETSLVNIGRSTHIYFLVSYWNIEFKELLIKLFY